jgi:hypothetical protein
MTPPHRPLLALAALALALLTGCAGSMYQPSRSAPLEMDAAAEIDDDDIRKAFEAKPQLPATLRVAYFTFAPEKADQIDRLLRAIPGVASTYRIPALVVSGQRRYQESSPSASRSCACSRRGPIATRWSSSTTATRSRKTPTASRRWASCWCR